MGWTELFLCSKTIRVNKNSKEESYELDDLELEIFSQNRRL